MKILKRYWFTFERSTSPTPLNLGCGVTAHSYDDALALLRERVFCGKAMPHISGYIEDVDVSTLDPKHVLPNIGLVVSRGIWFPHGF
jgi:hypothetical protein